MHILNSFKLIVTFWVTQIIIYNFQSNGVETGSAYGLMMMRLCVMLARHGSTCVYIFACQMNLVEAKRAKLSGS